MPEAGYPGPVKTRSIRARAAAALCCAAVVGSARAALAATYYVATGGSDTTGDGSTAKPWATIEHAVNVGVSAGGGDTVLVRDGTYSGLSTLQRGFPTPVTVRAEHDFHAILTNVAGGMEVIRVYVDGDANIVISGFVMTNYDPSYTCPNGRETYYLVHVQDASFVTITNNILHGNNAPGTCNEVLKLNRADPNAFTHDVRVLGNVFYDHAPAGGADLIDSDGSSSLEIADNIFFDNATETSSQSFWTLKGQPANAPPVPFPRHWLHRNVFLSWAGRTDQAFVQLGEDGLPRPEFTDALLENNLMIGDSPLQMAAPFQFKGVNGITVRANTLVGPFVAGAFGFRIGTEGTNVQVSDMTMANNIFDDPTGAMQDRLFNIYGDVLVSSIGLTQNLYYNDGKPLPSTGAILPSMDPHALVADPQIATDHTGIVLPRWDTTTNAFLSGSTTIREELVRLVNAYGSIPAGSPAVGAADPTQMPADDILGNPRDPKPDLGAFEFIAPAADGGAAGGAGAAGGGGASGSTGAGGAAAGGGAATGGAGAGGHGGSGTPASHGGCKCGLSGTGQDEGTAVAALLALALARAAGAARRRRWDPRGRSPCQARNDDGTHARARRSAPPRAELRRCLGR
jgi:hypothetical protein